MGRPFTFAVCIGLVALFGGAASYNLKPIIGILSQPLSRSMRRVPEFSNYTSYIASSYVKFMESGGARVVPIFTDQDDSYYEEMITSVNGLVFPGGAASLKEESSYGRAGRILYKLVKDLAQNGTEIPVMAVCLGFEMLLYMEAGSNPLTKCKASDRSDALIMAPGWNESQLFGEAPTDVMDTFMKTNSTSNFHKYCVTNSTFYDLDLDNTYDILSTNLDDYDQEYISTVEHKTLPIYAFQWHPEKNLFEWKYDSIPHFKEAIRSSQYITNLFIEKARNNDHAFDTKENEKSHLIYNHPSTHVLDYYPSSFQECYFFE